MRNIVACVMMVMLKIPRGGEDFRRCLTVETKGFRFNGTGGYS